MEESHIIILALFDRMLNLSILKWQKILEKIQIMQGLFMRLSLLIFGGCSKELCVAAYLFAKSVIRLSRSSGKVFTALYLKQCASSLQISYGGDRMPHTLLPTPVSLTRSGYPCIIPSYHRKMIRQHDEKAD